MFVGDDDNKPVNKATIKESKNLLHRLIHQQAIDTRAEYIEAVSAMNGLAPYRDTDPEVAEISRHWKGHFPPCRRSARFNINSNHALDPLNIIFLFKVAVWY